MEHMNLDIGYDIQHGKRLSFTALTNIFTDITQNSIVDVSGIVLYLSMITLFLFLTVQSIRRRLWESAAKKHGAYSVTMTAVFLAITVVINLIACQIPEKFRKIDVSNTKIYEISDTTEDFLKEMDKEISMKIIAVIAVYFSSDNRQQSIFPHNSEYGFRVTVNALFFKLYMHSAIAIGLTAAFLTRSYYLC